MTITLKGACCLGTTVPEPSRTEQRIYVCSAWWHDDVGLIRIYPLGMNAAPRRWHLYDVEVQRNPKDSRHESWQIAGDRRDPNINRAFRPVGELPRRERQHLTEWAHLKHIPESIPEANERRRSLALLKPEHVEFELEHNPESEASPQLRLFDEGLPKHQGAKRFPWIPRLKFSDGSEHRLMLRDWGVYEQMRKFPGRERDLPGLLHLGPKSALLVGNLNNRRRAWVVISVLNIIPAQLSLLEAS